MFAALCGGALMAGSQAAAMDQGPVSKTVIKLKPVIVKETAFQGPVLVASSKLPSGTAVSGAAGMDKAAGAEADDSDLFGTRGGYFHPYVTLGLDYTDNVFNVGEDTQSSWIGRVAPGVWFSMPRSRTVPVQITPDNTAPGGLQQQIRDIAGTERYQAYALGGLNYRSYSEDSDLNGTDGRLEGLFRYNFRGGLSLQALNSYIHGQDQFGLDSATNENLRRYDSNIFMATADWDMTEKLRAKVDYSNFILDYDDEQNDFLDRTDNVADIYGYYKYSPKTAFFLQYRYVDVGYDTDVWKTTTLRTTATPASSGTPPKNWHSISRPAIRRGNMKTTWWQPPPTGTASSSICARSIALPKKPNCLLTPTAGARNRTAAWRRIRRCSAPWSTISSALPKRSAA